MEDQFVPYDEALALESLGFDKPCLGYYNEKKQVLYAEAKKNNKFHIWNVDLTEKSLLAPTYQQANDFLMEEYGLLSIIIACGNENVNITEESEDTSIAFDGRYIYSILPIFGSGKSFSSFEDCEKIKGYNKTVLESIKYRIAIINKNKVKRKQNEKNI